ncbi:hypothetical protein BZA77DRAFT_112151 [Pyronema omphalodes]|nr:hypothetical protein BZA77DRAFT_112151 [Pyronema omphalodes]
MHALYVLWSVGLCNHIYVAICLSPILAAASRCRRFRNARYLRASMYLYGQLTRLKSLSCWKQLFGKLDTEVVRWIDSDYCISLRLRPDRGGEMRKMQVRKCGRGRRDGRKEGWHWQEHASFE